MTIDKVCEDGVFLGDCLEILPNIRESSVDLIYIDPPFYTQREHSLKSRKDKVSYSFDDRWVSLEEYIDYIQCRVSSCKRVLKDTGVLFFHCDTSANFAIRSLLNKVFGEKSFVSEIIWTYKRWSNSTKSLLPAHQTIFLFSKTDLYKFNHIYTDYSRTTNLDQILQKRIRNESGTVVYMRDEDGDVVLSDEKKGVPLSDVWEIPFLNPKAKERCGYPTQKPIVLLERMIELCSNEGDLVLDPFCGSGTALVAAKILKRRFVGIDKSTDAIDISHHRLSTMVKSKSAVLDHGRDSFAENGAFVRKWLGDIDVKVVHRNNGIDCFYTHSKLGVVPIKIQRDGEMLSSAVGKLNKANKGRYKTCLLLKTNKVESLPGSGMFSEDVVIADHFTLALDLAEKRFVCGC